MHSTTISLIIIHYTIFTNSGSPHNAISICLVLYLLNLSHSVTIVFKPKIKDNPSYSATFRFYLRVLYYNINACTLNNIVVECTAVEWYLWPAEQKPLHFAYSSNSILSFLSYQKRVDYQSFSLFYR